MPRTKRILQSEYPYHITLRAIQRHDFNVNIENLWSFSSDLLLFCSYAFRLEIHSFVLMNNHYHMLVRTPQANLNKFMNYFNRELSREITYKSGQINQKFGARYHATIVSDNRYYHTVYKYIYRNPVEANICERVQDYKFSSLNFLTYREPYRFPIFDTYFERIEDHLNNLAWLNYGYEQEEKIKIRKALKKTYFEL